MRPGRNEYSLQELNTAVERLREYLQDPFGNAGNTCQAPTPPSFWRKKRPDLAHGNGTIRYTVVLSSGAGA